MMIGILFGVVEKESVEAVEEAEERMDWERERDSIPFELEKELAKGMSDNILYS
jgi:hypothetical protein